MSAVHARTPVGAAHQVRVALDGVGWAVVVGTAAVVAVLTVADLTAWRPLRSPAWSGFVLVAVVALVVTAAVRWREREEGTARGVGWWAGLPAAPALVVVSYAVAGFLLPESQRVEWFLNGDHPRHLVLVQDLERHGALSYESAVYPRAWHSVVALLWAATPAAGAAPDVLGLVSFMATLTWLLSGLLALATAMLTVALAERHGLVGRAALLAGTGAGALSLWPWFFGNYQGLGLESSIVAAVVLAVTLREVLVRPSSMPALVVTVAGVVVVANTWQLLLPVSGLLVVVVMVAIARRAGARALAPATALVVAGGLVSLPSLVTVATRVGVGHATDADIVAPVPVVLLVLGLAALGVLAGLLRRDVDGLVVVGLMALPALTGVVLAWRVGVSVTTYYPGKLLWHSALLGVPAVAVVVALATRRLERRAAGLSRALARGTAVTAVGVAAVGALYAPLPALLGDWSTVDGAVVRTIVGTPEAAQAQVAWTGTGPVPDAVTRILLDAYRPEAGRVGALQEPATLEEECALLAAADRPTVVTARPEADARARYSCAPDARIVVP